MNTARRGRLLRCLLGTSLLGLLAASLLAVGACQQDKVPFPSDEVTAPDPETVGPTFFKDVTDASGIRFTYHNGEEAGHYAILESLGGGLALIDIDRDGKLDVFLPGGGRYGGKDNKEIQGLPCKLYRNKGNFQFEDISDRIRLKGPWFYTHGAAAGDFDGDGWTDLLITGWGRMALLHNEPVDPRDPSKGRILVDVTEKAKLPTGLWTTSAAWADLDGDGHPDLYVCQYVDWSFEHKHPIDCTYDGHTRDVCAPKRFKGLPHKVFRNNGDGTFTDVSKEAGLRGPREGWGYPGRPQLRVFTAQTVTSLTMPNLTCELTQLLTLKRLKDEFDLGEYTDLTYLTRYAQEALLRGDTKGETLFGKGLGVVVGDVNNDGRPDPYVANDTVDNFLYMNRTEKIGKIQFEEKGLETGTARDGDGNPNGSMGLDIGDPFGILRGSIWVTNYEHELHALYRNECVGGKEFFGFATKTSGLAATGQDTVGWGTGFLDLDHHGWVDLVFSTGHAIRHPTGAPRAERAGLFRNKGGGSFVDVRSRGGEYFNGVHVGRGLVLGDLDNDGKIDLIFCNLNEPVAVLRNIADTGVNHWLGIELAGKKGRDIVGSRVVLDSGGRQQARFATGGGSYASSGDRRLVFGLGPDKGEGLKLTVYWSWGKEEQFKVPAVDRYCRLEEGTGEAK
jgi:hypothetical protein